jgi:hypothetical protein
MLHQLLNYIERYLIAHCTLRDLEAWLLSNLQKILDSDDETVIEVANQVDADLIELGEGLIDEATLRERLESYIRFRETISLALLAFSETEPLATFHATAAVETIRNQLEVLGLVVDLRLDHVFA